MKPILVRNQEEWTRLAPVLNLSHAPYLPSAAVKKAAKVVLLDQPFLGYYSWTFASMYKEEAQSVDEYLALQEPKFETENVVTINLLDYQHGVILEPDHKALYEAEKAKYEKLLQGVRDAKAGINTRFKQKLDSNEILIADAYTDCLQIITEKTGV